MFWVFGLKNEFEKLFVYVFEVFVIVVNVLVKWFCLLISVLLVNNVLEFLFLVMFGLRKLNEVVVFEIVSCLV